MYSFNPLLVSIIGSLVLFQFSCSFPTVSRFSNLQRMSELKSKQISQLSNPMKDALDEEILLYTLCLQIQQDKEEKLEILGPFYQFGVEGVDITLQCSPCLPKGYPVSWSKITFENFQTEVLRTDGHTTSDLTLKSPQTDLSSYYCAWIFENKTEMIVNIWTVEIIPARNFEKITSTLNWKPKETFTQDIFTIQFQWQRWSDCNKCGIAGKRHRLGYCLIHHKKDKSSEIEYQSLQVYPSLSCSLFLTFHPEIETENQEVAQHLTERPKLMIGYCKVPCDYIDFNPEDRFLKSYPEALRLLYQNRSSDVDLREERDSDQDQGLRGMTAAEFLNGLRDIPITTDYLPEIFATLSLFALQVYILIQVFQNRAKAV